MGEKRAYLGNGTLERFLYVLPKSKLGYRTHDKPPLSTEIDNAYQEKIKNLLNHFSSPEKRPTEQLYTLTLAPTALASWRNFQATIEEELRPEGKFSSCQGWAGKICGFTLRIAGLLYVDEHGSENLTISDFTMMNALQIALLLTEHATAAYSVSWELIRQFRMLKIFSNG